MRPSKLLAGLAFLLLVPGSIALAFAGYDAGLYPYLAVPMAFGVIFGVLAFGTLAILPVVRRRLG